MNFKTVNVSCVVDGALVLTNQDAQGLLKVSNNRTWAKIRGAIGLPESIQDPGSVSFSEADIKWAWICQKWIDCRLRRGDIQTTYATFAALKANNTIDNFLGLLECLKKPANINEINQLIEDKKSCLLPLSTTSKQQPQRRKTKRNNPMFLTKNRKQQPKVMRVIHQVTA
jgi:hypothetical protein